MTVKHLLAAAFGATALVTLIAPGTSGATVDECIRKKVAAGTDRTKAATECLAENNNTPQTPDRTKTDSSDDEGTSTGLLLVAGVVGAAIGAIGATMLRKQKSGGAAPAAAPAPAVGSMPPPGFGAPPMAAPSAGPDRSQALVTTLVDLSDRVSSGALRAEIVAALAQAGVQALEPAQGTNFDPTTMRGVGSAPAPDPGWVGKVATTERAGFIDGGAIVRLPEVVVYTAGG